MLRLEVFARGDPHLAVHTVSQALSSSGAWVLDTHFFSGVAVTLVFEIAEQALPRLLEALRKAGLPPREEGLVAATETEEPVIGTLRVNLLGGDPRARRIVPQVPG